MRIIISIFTYIFIFVIPSYATREEANMIQSNNYIETSEIKRLCGVNSVYIVSALYGFPHKYSDVYRRLSPKEDLKSSIADLERVLNEYKIETHTLKLRPLQLYNNPNCLFIMYTPPPEGKSIGHFNVVRVIDEENIQVIDPPYSPRIIKKSDWISNDKIIFIAIGDNFNPPIEFGILKIISILMIISGFLMILYIKFSKPKKSSIK